MIIFNINKCNLALVQVTGSQDIETVVASITIYLEIIIIILKKKPHPNTK